jgi:hypothetical protein
MPQCIELSLDAVISSCKVLVVTVVDDISRVDFRSNPVQAVGIMNSMFVCSCPNLRVGIKRRKLPGTYCERARKH